MKTIKYPSKKDWLELIKRPVIDSASLEATVKTILLDVRENGDNALKKYSQEFDKVVIENLLVSNEEFIFAEKSVSEELKQAIQLAKSNIEKFHISQKEEVKQLKHQMVFNVGENQLRLRRSGCTFQEALHHCFQQF